MSGRRIILPSVMFTLAFLAAITTQAARSARADECLTKPTGPTPQGQHWYYRIDHANNGRQCWHLAPEQGSGQDNATQDETLSAPQSAAPAASPQMTMTPKPAASPQAAAPAPAPVAPAAAAAAPVRWLNGPRPPELPAFLQSPPPTSPDVRPSVSGSDPNPASAAAAAASKAQSETQGATPGATPNATSSGDQSETPSAEARPPNTVTPSRAGDQIRRAREMRKQAAMEAPRRDPLSMMRHLGEVDHIFALLMIGFAVLTITGPAIHFVERRRRRKAIAIQPPPRWANVVALDTTTPSPRSDAPPRPRQRTHRAQPATPDLPAAPRPKRRIDREAAAPDWAATPPKPLVDREPAAESGWVPASPPRHRVDHELPLVPDWEASPRPKPWTDREAAAESDWAPAFPPNQRADREPPPASD
ncbi:MAG TPA: hypothetical protein VJR71_10235, partial [Pseudolabrys sp.]|nr:hypothetical protein [Pseudolabrys sp.]